MMKNRIAKRTASVEPSLARKLFNMAREYNDVIDLTLGDPDFDIPSCIKKDIINAITENKTHYAANSGLPEARYAIAKHIEEIWNKKIDYNSQIIITVGAMEALFLGLSSLIDPGDEVIVFAPYYVNYIQIIKMLGGVPKIIDAYDSKSGFNIDFNILKDKISAKTKVIIINNPNNPTGAVFEKNTLSKIANIALENDIFVISDEVYRTLVFDNVKHESIIQFDEIADRFLLVDSLSKELCATGLRVGYACGCKEIIENMVKLQENVAACAPVPFQYAFINAYNSDNKNYVLDEFQKRRDFLYNEIKKINAFDCFKPQGAFYLFVDISKTGMDAIEFSEKLLIKEHVAVVPGQTYGEFYKNYIRIAFTKNIEILKNAIDKIKKFVSEI